MRGYFGVAMYNPKIEVNVGTLIRTAHILGANFVCTIGKRYKHQSGDTMKSTRHMPLFHFESFEAFKIAMPKNCALVAIELDEKARVLDQFIHPTQACYILGAEDSGLPQHILNDCNSIVRLKGNRSMNVAVAGSIVLHHRP